MRLSGLLIYPVKSLRGCPLISGTVDALGLVGDRRFMVVDSRGQFLSQRLLPRMALIHTRLDAHMLTLSINGGGEIAVARSSDAAAAQRTVSVWASEGLRAEDCGDEVATWLGDVLGLSCRLVRAGPTFTRPVRCRDGEGSGDLVNFADAYPFLVVSKASLANLNDRLVEKGEEALPLDRFRPNLVVSGCEAFAEDTWPRFRIGEIVFRRAGPCERCIVTTTNQETAEVGREPLRTLVTYRRSSSGTSVLFGQNLIHETKMGAVRAGDLVELLT